MADTIERLMICSQQLLEAGAEIERLQAALTQIEKLVHTPTPQGTKAYTHFMRDFDQVRAICRATLTTTEGR